MRNELLSALLLSVLGSASAGAETVESAGLESVSTARLERVSYASLADGERDFFVYLPVGADSASARRRPLILFLQGSGEWKGEP